MCLSWLYPLDTGGTEIIGFVTLRAVPDVPVSECEDEASDFCAAVDVSPGPAACVYGLHADTPYAFRVAGLTLEGVGTASGYAGFGAASGATLVVTDPPSPPSPPFALVQGRVLARHAIAFDFTEPLDTGGTGEGIVNYTLSMTLLPSGGTDVQWLLANASTVNTATFLGSQLPAASAFLVRLRANNAYALGAWSAPCTVRTELLGPGRLDWDVPGGVVRAVEGAARVSIPVFRSNGTSGTLIALVGVAAGGTAAAGGDFVLLNASLVSFADGQCCGSILVSLPDNAVFVSPPLHFSLSLVFSGQLSLPVVSMVIGDDGDRGVFRIDKLEYNGATSSGFVTFLINRTTGASGATWVVWDAVDDSAVADTDFVIGDANVSFADGQAWAAVNIQIMTNPAFNNVPRAFGVTLIAAGFGADIDGATSDTVCRIIDDLVPPSAPNAPRQPSVVLSEGTGGKISVMVRMLSCVVVRAFPAACCVPHPCASKGVEFSVAAVGSRVLVCVSSARAQLCVWGGSGCVARSDALRRAGVPAD